MKLIDSFLFKSKIIGILAIVILAVVLMFVVSLVAIVLFKLLIVAVPAFLVGLMLYLWLFSKIKK